MAGKGKSAGYRVFVANLAYSIDWKFLKDLFRDHGIGVRHVEILEDHRTGRTKGNAIVEVNDESDVDHAIEELNEMEIEGRRILVREDREDRPKGKGKDGKDGPKGKGKDGNGEKGKGEKGDRDYRDSGKADGKGKSRSWDDYRAPAYEERPGRHERHERREREEYQPPRQHRERESARGGACTGRVFIENLPKNYPWQEVKDLCRDSGLRVKHADIVEGENGVAVVEFVTPEDARAAVDTLNDVDVEGRRIVVHEEVEADQGRPPSRHGGGGRGGYDYRDSGREVPWANDDWDHRDRRGGKGGGYQSKGGGRSEEDWGEHRSRGGKDREEEPRRAPKRSAAEVTEDLKLKRLFAENLSQGVDWKELKDLFRGYFDILYADVVIVANETYGIVEFKSREDALEACMQFNGVLLNEKPVRLRQDRGEFHELRATKKKRTEPEDRREPEERPAKGREPYAGDAGRPRRGGHDGGKGGKSPAPLSPPQRGHDRGKGGKSPAPQRGHDGGKGGGKPGGPRVFVGNLDFRVSWQDLKDHMREAGNVRFCDVLKESDGRPRGCALVEYATEAECEAALATLNDTELGTRAIYVKWADEQRVPSSRR